MSTVIRIEYRPPSLAYGRNPGRSSREIAARRRRGSTLRRLVGRGFYGRGLGAGSLWRLVPRREPLA